MLPDISSNDLTQRYAGSYVKVSIKGVPQVDKITSINRDLVTFKSHTMVTSDEVTILQEFPEMGLVNFNGYVHIVSRQPIRQWCRGLKPNLIVDYCRMKHVKLFHENITLGIAEALFNRKWISIKNGVSAIQEGYCTSFAINNKYWFSGNKKHLYVWRNKVCIGEVLGKQIFFFSESSLLQEEINTDLKDIYAAF